MVVIENINKRLKCQRLITMKEGKKDSEKNKDYKKSVAQ